MNKLEQAARQALEALEELFHSNSTKVAVEKYNIAHNALREALMESNISDHKLAEPNIEEMTLTQIAAKHSQTEQKPIGTVKELFTLTAQERLDLRGSTKLYTAPVYTKDLTDDEAQKLWNDTSSIVPMWAHHLHFARAVIAADRRKNNANNNT